MAVTTTGTSTASIQVLQDFQSLTVASALVEFPSTPTVQPSGSFQRVGYLYIFCVNNTTPFQTRLLARSPLYRPGTYLLFPANFGFSAVKYSIIAKWDVPGLSWRCVGG